MTLPSAGKVPEGVFAASICGTICPCGPNGEPLACGYEQGHNGNHSWATLPTFLNGRTALERAAIEYVEASRSEADVAAATGRMIDPKRPTAERKTDALDTLIEEVDRAAS